MKKLLYIKKKSSNTQWSDVLDKQYNYIQAELSHSCDKFEVDSSSLYLYVKSGLDLLRIVSRYEVIYVNHIICAFPCIPSILFRSSKRKWVLALHEGEPVLGFRYLIRNLKFLSLKEWLRYSFLMQIPPLFYREILVLNGKQRFWKHLTYEQLNFLGIDSEMFKPNTMVETCRKLHLCFPNDPTRFGKGFNNLNNYLNKCGINFSLLTGGGVNYSDMPKLYNRSDIVVFCSDYETYSLAFLEAMAMNKFILTNSNLGIVLNLLSKYSELELAEFGIYIYQNASDFVLMLKKISSLINKQILPSTRLLFSGEGLDAVSANNRLLNYLGYEGY